MKTISIVLLFAIAALNPEESLSQSFMQGVGANISIVTAKPDNDFGSRFLMKVTHLTYFPRWSFAEYENASFTVGFPLAAGIGFVRDVSGDGAGISWGADAPIALDYNIGLQSTPDNDQTFGGYIGAGFGYMYTGMNMGDGANHFSTYGPIARGGIRFSSEDGRWNTTIGIFFKPGLEKAKYKTFGFNVLMDL